MEVLGYIFLIVLVVGVVFFVWKFRKFFFPPPVQPVKPTIGTNIFEQGKRSVELCNGEILVRAYDCAQLKSAIMREIKAQGVLTITNKRVIFHTIGYKNDDDFIHHEVPIQKVTAVTVQTGIGGNLFDVPKMLSFTQMFKKERTGKIFFLDIHAEGVSGQDGAIQVAPTNSTGVTITLPSYDVIPTDIVMQMANEIGAIIYDIINEGDYAVEKWKQEI